jgi:hypothetical protein
MLENEKRWPTPDLIVRREALESGYSIAAKMELKIGPSSQDTENTGDSEESSCRKIWKEDS